MFIIFSLLTFASWNGCKTNAAADNKAATITVNTVM
jgi:hypothetical protein